MTVTFTAQQGARLRAFLDHHAAHERLTVTTTAADVEFACLACGARVYFAPPPRETTAA